MKYRSQSRFFRQLFRRVHWRNASRSKPHCSLLLTAVFLLLVAPVFSADPPRLAKVLVLWFGDKDSPALTEFENGLRTTMERGLNAPVWVYAESFDEGWLGQGSPYAKTMERFLNDKYANRGIDIVVTIGNYPLQYMQRRRKTLLPHAKLIYFSLRHMPGQPIPQATGLVWRLDLAPTLEVALLQNPGTRHVLLIAGATAIDRALAQLFLPSGLKYLQERHNEVGIQILPPRTLAETRSVLAALPQDTVTVFICYYGDSAGYGSVPARILPTFSAITNRPMYGWIDSFLGRGIVGGSLVSSEAAGTEVGDLVVRVLHGEEPGNIPEVSSEVRQNEFDWQQMKRWGIGMDKVPAGSTVINREYTVWELYKWRIIGLLVLLAIEALLISVLIRMAVAQKRNLKQLASQREREALIAQLAAAFINLPAELVNAEITSSLQRLLEFFDLDRISLFEFSGGTTQLRLLCSRTSRGVEQIPSVINLAQLPWTASQILRGTPIVVSHLGELPEEASALTEVLRASGVRSFVAFPIQHGGNTFATLKFSTVHNEREWKPDLVLALQTIVDICGSALERKHAEEEVHQNRARLSGIVESAMDAIIAVDSQEHIVVFNATAERIFGCSMEEALGQSLERFIPNRFRAQHHVHISYFAETGVTNRAMGTLGALWALRANGEEFPIEASISQVKTDGGKLFTVIVRDITERQRSQQALRESEDRYRDLVEHSEDLICTHDLEGNLLSVNPAVASTLGYEVAELLRISLRQILLPEFRSQFDEYMATIRKDGEAEGLMAVLTRTGERRIWEYHNTLRTAGLPSPIVRGMAHDVTERKQAERDLHRSEQLKSSILGSLSSHIVVVDSRGIVVAVNDPKFDFATGNGLLGFSVGTKYFETCRNRIGESNLEETAALDGIQAVFDGKRDYFQAEYALNPGTVQPWLLMSVTPLKGADRGIVISHQDISERKRHEQAIHDLSGRLINAQEQERSRIARELHDDVNQQLALLAIELQQLESFFPEDSSEGRQQVQALWKKTHGLSTEVQQLTHQLHSTKLEHLGIVAALRGLCAEFSAQHKIGADFQSRQVPPTMDSDASLSLFRVAQESLHNVAKHSRAKKVRMELIGEGGKVVLRVSDDGVGFDPDALRNQSGLGMISMGERIRFAGGRLSVWSKPSMGTQVEAMIPLSRKTNAVSGTSQPTFTRRKTDKSRDLKSRVDQ